MSIFNFGRKNRHDDETPDNDTTTDQRDDVHEVGHRGKEYSIDDILADNPSPPHDAVSSEIGPYDGDSVNIDEFDMSDFADGHLDLGSIKVAVPHGGQIQVEMSAEGPKAIHVVTEVGRMTPVAFAAPRTAGYWDNHAKQIAESMTGDGLTVTVERGTWGNEIVGTAPGAVVRVIGVDGPRWMLRTTVAAPTESAHDAANLCRQMIARSFVYRGNEPRIAGEVLPIAVPEPLAQQISEAAAQHEASRNNRNAFAQKVAEKRFAAHQPDQRPSAEQTILDDNQVDGQ